MLAAREVGVIVRTQSRRGRFALPGFWRPALVSLILFVILLFPGSTVAQYMYIDTNTDGLHTDADVIAPNGATTLDIWIRTDGNRNGSLATCSSSDGPLDLSSYDFILHAVDGKVAWGRFVNVLSSTLPFGMVSDSTDFVSGYCSTSRVQPGLHRLAQLSIEVSGGSPTILIVPLSPLAPGHGTSFGTSCSGIRLDNTHLLGSDWFDVDGARFGGWTNSPSLAQPGMMVLPEASTAEQPLVVSDPDGSPVAVSKISGPAYVAVTQSQSFSESLWLIHLAPGFDDSGWAMVFIEATDGVAKDFRSFPVHVLNVNRPPDFANLPDVCIEQGETKSLFVRVTDPDNDPVTFTIEGEPAFARFLAGPGYFWLSVMPVVGGETGLRTVRITASDGSLYIAEELAIEVKTLGGCSGRPPLVARVMPNPMRFDGNLLFWTSKAGRLRVTLHDIRGRLVRLLLDEPRAVAGYHIAHVNIGPWTGGAHLPSGIYLYRIEAEEGVSTGRLTIIR